MLAVNEKIIIKIIITTIIHNVCWGGFVVSFFISDCSGIFPLPPSGVAVLLEALVPFSPGRKTLLQTISLHTFDKDRRGRESCRWSIFHDILYTGNIFSSPWNGKCDVSPFYKAHSVTLPRICTTILYVWINNNLVLKMISLKH